VVAVGDDGMVRLFNYPCVVEYAPCRCAAAVAHIIRAARTRTIRAQYAHNNAQVRCGNNLVVPDGYVQRRVVQGMPSVVPVTCAAAPHACCVLGAEGVGWGCGGLWLKYEELLMGYCGTVWRWGWAGEVGNCAVAGPIRPQPLQSCRQCLVRHSVLTPAMHRHMHTHVHVGAMCSCPPSPPPLLLRAR